MRDLVEQLAEAAHAWTWDSVRGTVESLAGAAKLVKWADEGNSYVVFVGGDKHMKAGYVTLVNVGETSGSGDHAGHFMLQAGIPMDFKGVDSLSIADTHEDMGESLKVFRALVAKAKGAFKVRGMARVADLEGYGRGPSEESSMRETLRSLEEAKGAGADATYAAFEVEAQALFLDRVAPRIKKLAGGHMQALRVVRDSTAWLEYRGEDLSDLPLEWAVTLVPKGNAVAIHAWGSRAGKAFPDLRVELASGVLRPSLVVDLFGNAFGNPGNDVESR